MPRPSPPEVQYQQLSAKAAASLGMPDGWKPFSPFPFGGMDQQSSRIALKDNEFYYRENFIRIGDGNLRTVWDLGQPIYTAPVGKTIIYFFFYNIGSVNYAAIFLNDGTALQVNSITKAQTVISSVTNTFYTGGQKPVCSQWGTLYLIIANNITPNSYWVWDGILLYTSGTLGPSVSITSGGAGYTSTPTVTVFGGSGSGAAVSATISDGSVVSVILTNSGTGYLPGDTVQFAFSGGGTDSSAILEANLAVGVVGSLQLVSPGSGYTAGTYALGFTGGGGTGATGTYTVAGGIVTTLNLTAGGSGYTGTPAISFPSGGGTGAAAIGDLSPGAVASVTVVNGGTNFTTTPTLTFQGGGGTGAAGTANLTSGVITSVTITNGGSGYISVPGVIVQSATNNSASAEASLMPFGISGSSIETFQQRVWLPFPNQTGNQENGGTFLVSAPGSLTDFSTSSGGLTYTSTDSFLRYQYTNIKQSNGYLYPIGDSSVDVISNVQTAGNPSSTTFNYQNTDPQIGTSWRDTLANFSRTILLVNPMGVYGLYGGSVTKISDKIDNLFTNMILPVNGGVTPCSAVANIFSRKILLVLMTITDVFTGLPRNVLISWDEKEWFVTSQSLSLTFVGSQEVNSTLTAWGTDGNSLYPLFNSPSSALTKTISTKLYGAQGGYVIKQAMSIHAQVQDLSASRSGVIFATTVDTELNVYPAQNTISLPAITSALPPYAPVFATTSGDTQGVNLGLTMSSTSPDFSLQHLIIGYIDVVGLFGSENLTGEPGE